MYELEHTQFVFVLINTQCKEKASIPPVDNFKITELSIIISRTYLQKTCHLAIPLHDQSVDFGFNLVSLIFVVGDVPARQSCFALSVLQQYKTNLKMFKNVLTIFRFNNNSF